ncbi:MAG TPA: hypothetical protein VMV22_11950 [Acidimicrobiales bacterium]|nr:hypothetical protein [Acidimicrobiales bacterium]
MRQRGEGRADPGPGEAATTGGERGPGDRAGRSHARWPRDVVGVAFTVAAAALVLVPALRPGVTLGPFDLLTRFGLTRHAGVAVHNAVQADQIQQFVPWTNLAWAQVHAGHLPLWNPYSVLGMPLAFNWQSGVFSVPALVGYLFPVAYAYTAIVLTKLVIAGTGAYVLCRVLRLGPLAAAFGGAAFELSGPMIVHAGWPHTSVTCWAGWMLAAVVGILRGAHRFRHTALLAVVIGLAVYGGHPESLVAVGVAVVVFVVVYVAARARVGGGPVVRPLGDLVAGAVCGFGLGAPLLFPGLQLGLASTRSNGTGTPAFPVSHLPNLLAVGLQGKDFKTAAYVGTVALAMAVVGARVAWRRPEVPALAAVAVVTLLLTFLSPVDQALHVLPGGRTVAWSRAVMLMALALAVLAAVGIDALARPARDRTAIGWAAGAFGVLALSVLVLVVASAVGLAPAIARHRGSLVWPAAQAVIGVAVAGGWWWARRGRPDPGGGGGPDPGGSGAPRAGVHAAPRARGRAPWAALVLVALETTFLLSAGIPSWSVGPAYFPTNPAITTLQHHVGSALVGYGSCRSLRYLTPSATEVGIRPDANIGYGIHEFTVYDPILPTSYFEAWLAAGGQRTPPSLEQLGMFCAHITTLAQALEFGVQYVLEPPGRFRPFGSFPAGNVGTETLAVVPGAAPATASPVPPGGAQLPTDAPGTPLAVTYPDPASWRLVVSDATASIVRLRLTNVPGWRATIDGRPLSLRPWAVGSMLQAQVPAGRHVIELHYWPAAFTWGLDVAGAVAGGLVLTGTGRLVLVLVRRRRGRTGVAP